MNLDGERGGDWGLSDSSSIRSPGRSGARLFHRTQGAGMEQFKVYRRRLQVGKNCSKGPERALPDLLLLVRKDSGSRRK